VSFSAGHSRWICRWHWDRHPCSQWTLSKHVAALCRSGFFRLWLTARLLTAEAAKTLVEAFVYCSLDYCNSLLYIYLTVSQGKLQVSRFFRFYASGGDMLHRSKWKLAFYSKLRLDNAGMESGTSETVNFTSVWECSRPIFPQV